MDTELKSWIKQKTPPAVWGFIRAIYYGAKNWNYRKRVVRHNYSGTHLKVWIADSVAAAWYDFDWGPSPEIDRLKQRKLRPGARVFDIGAHQCVAAMVMAEAVGPLGQVIAVEGSPHDAAVGERNRKLNSYENLTILHAAIGETSGRIAFTTGGHVHHGKNDYDGRIWVDAFSIDDLADRFGPPDVLYLDVDGYEVHALRGARKTLAQFPDCLIEVHPGAGLEAFGETVESALSFFPPQQFDLWIRRLEYNEDGEFVPLLVGDPRLRTRFHLLALGRQQSPAGAV